MTKFLDKVTSGKREGLFWLNLQVKAVIAGKVWWSEFEVAAHSVS